MKQVPASRGLRWMIDGANLLGQATGPLATIAALWLVVSLIQFVPLIGPLLLILSLPLLTAGLLTAFDRVARGRRPDPLTLFDGWRNPRTRSALIVLGLFVVLGLLALMVVFSVWLGASASPEELERLTQSPEALLTFIGNRNPWALLLPVVLCSLALLAGLYFSVPLVKFADTRPVPAIMTSIRACLLNWKAFIVFCLVAVAVSVAAGLIVVLVVAPLTLAFGNFAGGVLAQIPMIIIALMVQLIFAGAQYRAFVEIFALPESGVTRDDPDDNQLLV